MQLASPDSSIFQKYSYAIYVPQNQGYIAKYSSANGFKGSTFIPQQPGQYEMRIAADDVLVAVLPSLGFALEPVYTLNQGFSWRSSLALPVPGNNEYKAKNPEDDGSNRENVRVVKRPGAGYFSWGYGLRWSWDGGLCRRLSRGLAEQLGGGGA